MLWFAVLAGWIAVSIPATLAVAHAAGLAAEREAERRAGMPAGAIGVAGNDRRHRTA